MDREYEDGYALATDFASCEVAYPVTKRQLEAKELVGLGLTYNQVGLILGITGPAVYYLCNPDKRRAAARKFYAKVKRDREAAKSIEYMLLNATDHENGALEENREATPDIPQDGLNPSGESPPIPTR